MPSQLPVDCLNEIFEYLDDRVDLHSCLLVNHFWCEVSVQILWKSIQNYNTLIACLSDESKQVLHMNEIIISTPTSKHPLFNYVTFIKNLSMNDIFRNILRITFQDFNNYKCIVVTQEIFKMFMNQTSLKRLDYSSISNYTTYLPFTTYPGAMDCLRNLSEFKCNSDDLSSEFFYQLSQICHNIQSLTITFEKVISNGLADLISVQRNLK